MKRVLMMLLVLVTITAAAQPKSVKEAPKVLPTAAQAQKAQAELSTIEVKGTYRTDSVQVKITVEAEEGYLKRIDGWAVVRSFTPVQGQPQIVDQKFYDNKYVAIKPEVFVGFAQKQNPPN